MFILDNFKSVQKEIALGNNLGEPITLVGATKTVPVEIINEAIGKGLKVVAENKAQEFNAKHEFIKGASEHFIGHLQSNKVKYLVGKVHLIHSVDSVSLAECISKTAIKREVTQDILIEVNIGGELSKSGFTPENAIEGALKVNALSNVNVKGFMAMLPNTTDEQLKVSLCKKMRKLFDELKATLPQVEFLSMGMSADYKIAIQNGSNMIRLGSTLFGQRV